MWLQTTGSNGSFAAPKNLFVTLLPCIVTGLFCFAIFLPQVSVASDITFLRQVSVASDITFAFRGPIESIEGAISAQLQLIFEPGDVIEGTYSFDPSTPDIASDPREGFYANAITDYEVYFGGNLIASQSATGENYIHVRNNAFDHYYAVTDAEGSVTRSIFVERIVISLFSSDNSVFPSDELPLTPPPLQTFSTTFFAPALLMSDASGNEGRVNFSLDSLTLVPEPSTNALALVVFFLANFARRSSRGSFSQQKVGRMG